MTKAEAEAIYANWNAYPDDKDRQIVSGERLWVKLLPHGLRGLNNHPLDRAHRWQDIRFGAKLVYRRWNTSIGFVYKPRVGLDDLATRQLICQTLKADDVEIHFFWASWGYAEFKSADDAACRARLATPLLADVVTNVAPQQAGA